MQIKLHGKFAEDYPGDFFIEADTVAEALEGWSRQVGFYEDLPHNQRPIARVVGRRTVESLYEKTEQNEVHIVPAMSGGGGKFGSIILGSILVVVGFFTTPYLTMIGISMIISGVMGLFIKAPSISKSNDPDASKYLGLSNNTTAIGTPIAICYGRVPVDGHVLALNVDSTEMVTGTFPGTPT